MIDKNYKLLIIGYYLLKYLSFQKKYIEIQNLLKIYLNICTYS